MARLRPYTIITEAGEYLTLDATTSMSMQANSSSTDSRVETGAIISDHVDNDNIVFSLSGVISDLKLPFLSEAYSPEDFLRVLNKIRNESQTFSFFATSKLGSAEGILFENCVLTGLTVSQNTARGIANNGRTHAYQLALTIKQIELGLRTGRKPQLSLRLKDTVAEETETPQSAKAVLGILQQDYLKNLPPTRFPIIPNRINNAVNTNP